MPEPRLLSILEDYPEEGQIAGRLVLGYGEIEFGTLLCLAAVLGDVTRSIGLMYRVRSEEQRLLVADALMRPAFEKAGLKDRYCEATTDAQHCRRIRNQYAHCHWGELATGEGLSFISLDDSARTQNGFVRFWPIDRDLLKKQERFFLNVQQRLRYLSDEYKVRVGQLASHDAKAPRKVARPPLHSAPA